MLVCKKCTWRYKYHTQFSSCQADGRYIEYYEIVSEYNDLVHDAKAEQFTPIRCRSDIPFQKIVSCDGLFASDATHEAARKKKTPFPPEPQHAILLATCMERVFEQGKNEFFRIACPL